MHGVFLPAHLELPTTGSFRVMSAKWFLAAMPPNRPNGPEIGPGLRKLTSKSMVWRKYALHEVATMLPDSCVVLPWLSPVCSRRSVSLASESWRAMNELLGMRQWNEERNPSRGQECDTVLKKICGGLVVIMWPIQENTNFWLLPGRSVFTMWRWSQISSMREAGMWERESFFHRKIIKKCSVPVG